MGVAPYYKWAEVEQLPNHLQFAHLTPPEKMRDIKDIGPDEIEIGGKIQ